MIDNIYDEDFVKKVFLERFHGDVNEDIIEALIDNMFDEDFIKTVVTEYLHHPISSKLKKAISEYCYDDIDFSAIDSKKTSDQTLDKSRLFGQKRNPTVSINETVGL